MMLLILNIFNLNCINIFFSVSFPVNCQLHIIIYIPSTVELTIVGAQYPEVVSRLVSMLPDFL